MSLLGIDIGGTKTAVVIGTTDGEILAREEFPTNQQRGFDAFMKDVDRVAKKLLKGRKDVYAASICCGGPLDEKKGTLIKPPHLSGWKNIRVSERVEKHFGLPTYLMHDARAGAYAEYWFGLGRKIEAKSLGYLTFATGFGCGVVHNGYLLDIPGEIGHWRVAESGPKLFDKRGSLEGLASGTGIAMQAAESGKFGDAPDVKQLAEMARKGNRDALTLLEAAAVQVGRQCSRMIDFLGLDAIALGTIAVEASDLVLDRIIGASNAETLRHLAAKCTIEPAGLGRKLGDVASLSAAIAAGVGRDPKLGPTVRSQAVALACAAQDLYTNSDAIERLDEVIQEIAAAIEAGGKLLTCGNGGSATDANHLAEELVGRYRGDRPSLPAVSLSADGGVLTCIGNDYGFDEVFSRQVESLGRKGDVLVAFSTSGKSENINRAIRTAKKRGLMTVALLGKTGGKAKDLADHAFVMPSNATERIQELHTFCLHAICEGLETRFNAKQK